MKLQRVVKGSVPVSVVCKQCVFLGYKKVMHREIECYADLDGRPGDFYCQTCAENLAPNQTDGELVYARED